MKIESMRYQVIIYLKLLLHLPMMIQMIGTFI